MSDDSELPWYRDGLRFKCTRCGRCCRGEGNVWVTDAEIESLARLEGTSTDEFRRSHVRRHGREGQVLGQKQNHDCIFWDDGTGCQVYAARPRQCATYPFWQANLQSAAAWESEGRSCPGLGEGSLRSRETIESLSADDGIPDHRTRLRVR